MIIGVDLDEVCYRWVDTAIYMIKYKFGVELQHPQKYIRNPEEWGLTDQQWEWLWGAAIGDGVYRRGDAYPGTKDSLQFLANMGHELCIITQRPFLADYDTVDWVTRYLPEVELVHLPGCPLTGPAQPKSSVTPQAHLYIDDSPSVVADLLENTNATVLLWQRPWNQDCRIESPRLYRIGSWGDVVQCVEEKNAELQSSVPVLRDEG